MLSRRDVTTGFAKAMAALSLSGVVLAPGASVAAEAPSEYIPVNKHPINHTIFGNRVVPGMTWEAAPTITWEAMSEDKFTPSPGVPTYEALLSEIHAALLFEVAASVTEQWLSEARERAPVIDTFDAAQIDLGNRTFIGDVHAFLPAMVRDAAQADPRINTVIVSPTALTIMQSATNSSIERIDLKQKPPFTYGPEHIGFLPVPRRDPIRILVDAYGWVDTPVLLGAVHDDPEKRPVQIVRTGLSEVALGRSSAHVDEWKRIDMNDKGLTFI